MQKFFFSFLLTSFALSLSNGFFLLSPVFAQTDEGLLICPRSESIPNFTENSACQSTKAFEILSGSPDGSNPSAFEQEVQAFQTEVLDNIYRDNQSNPNAITELGVLKLREHEQCLIEICAKVFEQCGKNISKYQNLEQESWCLTHVNQILNRSRSSLYVNLLENNARKERSLFRQTLTGMFTRSRQYFSPWMLKTVNDIRSFKEKVYNFIRDPL